MKRVSIDREKTICVTGHRSVESDLDLEYLEYVFLRAIKSGIDTFLIGMAVGYDTLCFQILERIRKQRKIRIIACVPCLEQDKFFKPEQKKEYKRLLSVADGRVIISDKYTHSCMMERNRFMVDNSSFVIAYLNKKQGGSYSTVQYAIKQGVKCVILPQQKMINNEL